MIYPLSPISILKASLLYLFQQKIFPEEVMRAEDQTILSSEGYVQI